jgi:hypothetical protein
MRPEPSDHRDEISFDDVTRWSPYLADVRKALHHYGYEGDPLSILPSDPVECAGLFLWIAAEMEGEDERGYTPDRYTEWFDEDGNPRPIFPGCARDALEAFQTAMCAKIDNEIDDMLAAAGPPEWWDEYGNPTQECPDHVLHEIRLFREEQEGDRNA